MPIGADRRAPVLAASWNEILPRLDSKLLSSFADKASGDNELRHFLFWVADSTSDDALSFRILLRDGMELLGKRRAIAHVIDAVLTWSNEAPSLYNWSHGTLRRNRLTLIKFLSLLANNAPRSFPEVHWKAIRFEFTPASPRPSLGVSDWGELGAADLNKDVHALKLVREDAVKIFNEEYAVFKLGQMVLSEQPRSVECSDEVWRSLRILLRQQRICLLERRHSLFLKKWSNETVALVEHLSSASVWRKIGVDPRSKSDHIEGSTIALLFLRLLGATKRAAAAVQTVLCCDTGWNRQPIQDLNQNPFAYRSGDGTRIASSRLLIAFKNRAHHHVSANIDDVLVVAGISAQNISSIWDEMPELEECHTCDEHALIKPESDLLGILSRLHEMTSIARSLANPSIADLMFLVLTSNNCNDSLVSVFNREIKECIVGDICSRREVTFSAIRKSHLNAMARTGIENDHLRVIAGHHSTGILEQHYRNDASAAAEHEQAIRYFQESIQVIASGNDVRLALNLDERHVTWFMNLAKINGIASACGIGIGHNHPEDFHELVFIPSRENLIDLYLAHRALKSSRIVVARSRWLVQGLPLLASVKAIGLALLNKGLGSAYKESVRAALFLLREEKISLPIVLEN